METEEEGEKEDPKVLPTLTEEQLEEQVRAGHRETNSGYWKLHFSYK